MLRAITSRSQGMALSLDMLSQHYPGASVSLGNQRFGCDNIQGSLMVCAEVGQHFHFCLQIKTLKKRPYILHVLCILYFSDFKRGGALWGYAVLGGAHEDHGGTSRPKRD